jgi:hypothetical protein
MNPPFFPLARGILAQSFAPFQRSKHIETLLFIRNFTTVRAT